MARMTFDVGPDFDRVLTETAKKKGTTKAEIIRRSVASYVYLDKERDNGSKVQVTPPPGSDEGIREIILP